MSRAAGPRHPLDGEPRDHRAHLGRAVGGAARPGRARALELSPGRMQIGRYVYAIGGNAEAARRAGISVSANHTLAFTLTGLTAGIAGIVYASRLRSISTTLDGGTLVLYAVAAAVIGGTSLMGGRGQALHGVLGGIVIAAIYNGMGLDGLRRCLPSTWSPRSCSWPPSRSTPRRTGVAPPPETRPRGRGSGKLLPWRRWRIWTSWRWRCPRRPRTVADDGRPSYLVHGKMFCFHRSRRPDAVDPATGERLDDVLMFRVPDLEEKELLLSDDRGIYFTTPPLPRLPGSARAHPGPGPARPRRAARRRRRRLADARPEARRQGLAR